MVPLIFRAMTNLLLIGSLMVVGFAALAEDISLSVYDLGHMESLEIKKE